MLNEKIEMKPIGIVCSDRLEPIDDQWDGVKSIIEIDLDVFSGEALLGLSDFSHCEVIYFFHKVNPEKIEISARVILPNYVHNLAEALNRR